MKGGSVTSASVVSLHNDFSHRNVISVPGEKIVYMPFKSHCSCNHHFACDGWLKVAKLKCFSRQFIRHQLLFQVTYCIKFLTNIIPIPNGKVTLPIRIDKRYHVRLGQTNLCGCCGILIVLYLLHACSLSYSI